MNYERIKNIIVDLYKELNDSFDITQKDLHELIRTELLNNKTDC